MNELTDKAFFSIPRETIEFIAEECVKIIDKKKTIDPKKETKTYTTAQENATFTAPKLEISKNIAKINNKNYKLIYKDNITFLVENKRQSKNTIIYSGLINLSIKSGVLKSTKAYLVEEGCFSAHGQTLIKAMEDLKFKIISEKIKNEPINADTKITLEIYRMITGACEIGCRHFMDMVNIPYKIIKEKLVEDTPVLAKDLLPLIEKHNSYGYDKFKQLVTF